MDYQVYPEFGFGDFADYGALPSDIGSAFGSMAGVFAVVYMVAFLFGIAIYIAQSIAFMKMAKKVGVRNGWLSFIPIGNIYILGRVADAGKEKRINTIRMMISTVIVVAVYVLLVALLIAAIVTDPMADEMPALFLVPTIVSCLVILVAAICLAVFEYIAMYRICDNFGGKDGTVYFVGVLLGTFFMPIVTVVLFLILAGKTPEITDAPIITPVVEHPTDSVF